MRTEETVFGRSPFASELHQERIASWLGLALGISFGVCFITGLLSHLIQHPPGWFSWSARPVWVYRVSQGIHVATGIATIPLLLGKLWTVYPKLFRWPPVAGLAHALERLALLPLVGGSLFLLFTGVAGISRWNPWPFSYPPAHYWAAWLTVGGLIVHIGAKAGVVRRSLSHDSPEIYEVPHGGLSRRGFLVTIAGAAGAITLFTIGQTLRPLEGFGLLAPRKPSVGPQGFPVTKTAASAKVTDLANSTDYRLSVTGKVEDELSFSLDQLRSLPQRDVVLPISCVDGWSATVHWRGVRLSDLLSRAGAAPGGLVRVESLQAQTKPYSSVTLDASHVSDEETLIALECNGEPLDIDHGYPARLIAPNQPGVMQTKWVSRVVAL